MSIALETKSADPAADASRAFDDFARAFEAFKETNDARLGEIETRARRPTSLTEEKLARIDAALDERQAAASTASPSTRAPAAARRPSRAAIRAAAEHKAAFDAYMRGRRERRPAAARGQGAVGRLRPRRRLSRAGRDRARDLRAARRDLADPRDRLRARRSRRPVYKKPFSTAGAGVGLGRRDRARGRRPTRRRSPS